jgi:hypothetical protein
VFENARPVASLDKKQKQNNRLSRDFSRETTTVKAQSKQCKVKTHACRMTTTFEAANGAPNLESFGFGSPHFRMAYQEK